MGIPPVFRRVPATGSAAVMPAVVAERRTNLVGPIPWHGNRHRRSRSASPPQEPVWDHRIGLPRHLGDVVAAPRQSPRRTSLATTFDPPTPYNLPRESCLSSLSRA